MIFTKEQREQLNFQGKEIYNYIKENICPFVKDSIKVEFGEMTYRGRCNEIYEHEYNLYVRKDEIFGGQGGLTLYFVLPEWVRNSCGNIDVFNDNGFGTTFLYNLCLSWKDIKMTLNTNIQHIKEDENTVFKNFSL